MKKGILLLILSAGMLSSKAQNTLKVYESFDDFSAMHLENLSSDTTYVINFWATWCRPCVQELPLFDSLTSSFQDKPLKVLLVSLDLVDSSAVKLKAFIKKKEIQSEVVVLTDGNSNYWIDLIDPNWSGAIPYTIMIHNEKKSFHEKQYHNLSELKEDIIQIKQQ